MRSIRNLAVPALAALLASATLGSGTAAAQAVEAGEEAGTVAAVRFEAEQLSAAVSKRDRRGPRTSAQSGVTYSGDRADRLYTNARGDFITYDLAVPAPGTYRILRRALKANSAGIHRLLIDGVAQGAVHDSYSRTNVLTTFDHGERTFATAGVKRFTFQATGKARKSRNYNLTTDYLELVPVGAAKPGAGEGEPTARGTKVEGEKLPAVTSGGDKRERFRYAGLSGGFGDRFNGNAVGDFISYQVPLPASGTYTLKLRTRTYRARGIYQLAIDGTNHGSPIDTYTPKPTHTVVDLGQVTFTSAGPATFRFTAVGKNRSSKGYGFLVDYVELVPATR